MEKKFRQVFIHMGGGKTGSTAIQGVFKQVSSVLVNLGLVAYPPDEAHSKLGSFFSECPEEYVFNVIWYPEKTRQALQQDSQEFMSRLRQWIEDIRPCNCLVFSCEAFPSLDVSAMQDFKEFAENYADIVDVIYYVRPPLSFAISAISQNIKQGIVWNNGASVVEKYKNSLEKMLSVFGKQHVNVRDFSSIPKDGLGVIGDFSKIIGIPDEITNTYLKSNSTEYSNKSLSNNAVNLGVSIIKNLSSHGVKYYQGEFFTKFGRYLSEIPGDTIKLSSDMVEDILAISCEHSNFLAKEFNIVFYEKAEKYLEPLDNISYEKELLLNSIGEMVGGILAVNRNTEMSLGWIKAHNPPTVFNCGVTSSILVTIFNASKYPWLKKNLDPINLSYHWKERDGRRVVFNGLRTAFPEDVLPPNESLLLSMNIQPPNVPGNYFLELSIVREGMYWFEDMGFKSFQIEVKVKPSL